MGNFTFRRRAFLQMSVLASALLANPFRRAHAAQHAREPAEFFIGPFPSWTNLKTRYGARGDGRVDDTIALQTALDELSPTNPVLWIPNGTYRITKTLTWTRSIGEDWMSIWGEHPATTKIVWDGAREESMFTTHNINNSRFARLTWDGAARARYAIQHTSSGSSSGNEHVDEYFENVDVGIRGGTVETQMVAEMSVRRCRFKNCARAGISIENANSLDWWIWHSLFEDCYVGVTAEFGQGSFHIFNSTFKRSTFADTFFGFGVYHVLADNFSQDSRAFCLAPFSGNVLPLVLQRNVILDPTLGANPPEPRAGGLASSFPYELRGPISVKYFGPLIALDNVIRSRANQNGPVIESGQDLLAVGNQFTIDNALEAKRIIAFDNHMRAAASIYRSTPAPPEPPPPYQGKIFHVPRSADAAQMQTQINAATQTGKRAVVHFEHGEYSLLQTLTIPAASDIQLVGDGPTILKWDGAPNVAAVEIDGAARVVLRDLVIHEHNWHATGIRISNADRANTRVLMQGVHVRASRHGIRVDACDNAWIELRDTQSVNAFFDAPSARDDAAILVRGGTRRARGETTPGRVLWFSGASSGAVPTFRVERGGCLLARAIWHEGRAAHVARLDDAGEFTLLGALLARYATTPEPAPAFDVENFRGRLAVIATQFNDDEALAQNLAAVRVRGSESNLRVLLLGACGWTKRVLRIDAAPRDARVARLLNRSPAQPGDYVLARADEFVGDENARAQFLRVMLETARRARPLTMDDAAQQPALHFERVYVTGFETAIHLLHDSK